MKRLGTGRANTSEDRGAPRARKLGPSPTPVDDVNYGEFASMRDLDTFELTASAFPFDVSALDIPAFPLGAAAFVLNVPAARAEPSKKTPVRRAKQVDELCQSASQTQADMARLGQRVGALSFLRGESDTPPQVDGAAAVQLNKLARRLRRIERRLNQAESKNSAPAPYGSNDFRGGFNDPRNARRT